MRLSPLCFCSLLAFAQPPATPKKPVTDTYHGTKVTDDYRWLENYSDPAVKAWSDSQNRYARKLLDALPLRQAIFEQLRELNSHPSPSYGSLVYRRGILFALKTQPPAEQPMLVTLKSPDDPSSERVIVDPNRIDAKGGTEIDFYVPSLDGKRVAVSMSKGGSESGDLHIFDVASSREIESAIPHVNNGTAGGSAAWNADGSGLYYTRYPRAGERPPADMDFYQQVYFHKLGAAANQDTYALGKEFPRIAEITLNTSDDGRYIHARMANGDGGEFSHYLLGPSGEWSQIARLADEIPEVDFGPDGNLYLLSHLNAPMGKVLRTSLTQPQIAGAQTVVPEGKFAIQTLVPASHFLYVIDEAGGPMQIRAFDSKGIAQGVVPLKTIASVTEALRTTGDDLLYASETYLEPVAWYRYNPTTRKATPTALHESAPANYSDAEVIREFATSKDGTKIPLNIIRRKGTKLDGTNPVLLYGYGGYNISLTPFYSVHLRPLLDRGVVYVIANIRGGGEYGEAWHQAGMLTRKQNVFDDFAAAAHWLIDNHYTNPSKLAIEGGSNGGLLMGAELTQHPDLFRAVVSHVGIYDMLRVELSPNGAFNVTEFGTVKEADQFRALNAYSPYHHVVNGTQYPAILFMTGDNDPRVDPANSRKMTAKLQASGTKLPVLLRTTSIAGHGIGTALSERIAEDADAEAFILSEIK